MKEQPQVMTAGKTLHDRHHQLVLVVREVRFGKFRGKFELAGGDFIVAGLDGDSQARQFPLYIFHVSENLGVNRAGVVVLKLLPFRGLCPAERVPAKDDVGA